MRSEPICVYVYINGEIIQSSSANAVFRGDKTKSLLLNLTITLSNIITAIQSSITDADVSSAITSICYRCPIHEMNGHVEHRTCPITDEEDVWCMFNTFTNMPSVICMELRVEVHTSPSPFQAMS